MASVGSFPYHPWHREHDDLASDWRQRSQVVWPALPLIPLGLLLLARRIDLVTGTKSHHADWLMEATGLDRVFMAPAFAMALAALGYVVWVRETPSFLAWFEGRLIRREPHLDMPGVREQYEVLLAKPIFLLFPLMSVVMSVAYFCAFRSSSGGTLDLAILVRWFVAPAIWLMIVAFGVWPLLCMATTLRSVLRRADMRIMVDHPDKVGGVERLGLYVLLLATPVALGAALLSVVLLFPVVGGVHQVVKEFAFFSLATIAAPSAAYLFIGPVLPLHAKMRTEREQRISEALAQREPVIGALHDSLTHGQWSSADERMKTLDALSERLSRLYAMGTWPISRAGVLQFGLMEAVPVLVWILRLLGVDIASEAK